MGLFGNKIKFKVIGKDDEVVGKVIVFFEREFGIEVRTQNSITGEIYRVTVDNFNVNEKKNKSKYKLAFYNEVKRHVSKETRVVYIEEGVNEYIENH